MERKSYVAANKAAWNEVAPRHAAHNQEKLVGLFSQPGFSCLDEIETALLHQVGVVGKDVIQLACNNGRELLSIKNIGAARSVGVDVSSAFIEQATALANAGNIEAEFICCDVYELDLPTLGTFDVVYISIGALCWMPDLSKFFEVVRALLKVGGQVMVYDCHPILDMFEPEEGFEPRYSYFRREPFVQNDGLDYYSGKSYAAETYYSFCHTLGDCFAGITGNGFVVTHFEEYAHNIAEATWRPFAEKGIQLPLSFTLIGKKI